MAYYKTREYLMYAALNKNTFLMTIVQRQIPRPLNASAERAVYLREDPLISREKAFAHFSFLLSSFSSSNPSLSSTMSKW